MSGLFWSTSFLNPQDDMDTYGYLEVLDCMEAYYKVSLTEGK